MLPLTESDQAPSRQWTCRSNHCLSAPFSILQNAPSSASQISAVEFFLQHLSRFTEESVLLYFKCDKCSTQPTCRIPRQRQPDAGESEDDKVRAEDAHCSTVSPLLNFFSVQEIYCTNIFFASLYDFIPMSKLTFSATIFDRQNQSV